MVMKKIALWVLGQMLPREEVFDRHIRHLARGVTYLVCGGVVITAIFLALLGALYMALVDQGLSTALAGTLTGIVALLGAAVCFLLADKSLSRASKLTDELKVGTPTLPKIEATLDLQEAANTLLNAFIDGVRGRAGTPYQKHKRLQEDLFERLERLEAELEAELEEEAANHRVEREYDENKDIIRFRPRHTRRDEEAG